MNNGDNTQQMDEYFCCFGLAVCCCSCCIRCCDCDSSSDDEESSYVPPGPRRRHQTRLNDRVFLLDDNDDSDDDIDDDASKESKGADVKRSVGRDTAAKVMIENTASPRYSTKTAEANGLKVDGVDARDATLKEENAAPSRVISNRKRRRKELKMGKPYLVKSAASSTERSSSKNNLTSHRDTGSEQLGGDNDEDADNGDNSDGSRDGDTEGERLIKDGNNLNNSANTDDGGARDETYTGGVNMNVNGGGFSDVMGSGIDLYQYPNAKDSDRVSPRYSEPDKNSICKGERCINRSPMNDPSANRTNDGGPITTPCHQCSPMHKNNLNNNNNNNNNNKNNNNNNNNNNKNNNNNNKVIEENGEKKRPLSQRRKCCENIQSYKSDANAINGLTVCERRADESVWQGGRAGELSLKGSACVDFRRENRSNCDNGKKPSDYNHNKGHSDAVRDRSQDKWDSYRSDGRRQPKSDSRPKNLDSHGQNKARTEHSQRDIDYCNACASWMPSANALRDDRRDTHSHIVEESAHTCRAVGDDAKTESDNFESREEATASATHNVSCTVINGDESDDKNTNNKDDDDDDGDSNCQRESGNTRDFSRRGVAPFFLCFYSRHYRDNPEKDRNN